MPAATLKETKPKDALSIDPSAKPASPAAQAKFVQGNLFRHIAVMSSTASVGLMAIFLVDLINVLYISWLQDPVLTAAVGYGGVVFFFALALGIGLSIGISVLVARAVGARDQALAKSRAINGLVTAILLGSLFAGLVVICLPWIVAALGATGRTADETILFLQINLASQPFMMAGIVGSAILRSYGEARRAMMVTVWAAVFLFILDPILIFWFKLELLGVALASVASRILMAFVALYPLWKRFGGFGPISWPALIADLRPIFAISGPAILTQMATPVGQAIVTAMVAGFGEEAVAGIAITARLTPVAFAMIFAMAGALGPILGQNLGAGRMDRVRQGAKDATIFMALVILLASVILFALRGPISDIFHAEGVTREMIYLFCGPLSLLFFFNGLIFVANAICNNLGAAMQSSLVNWARHTLGTWPFAYLGMIYWGAGGVLIGQALGGIVFGLLAIWLAWRVIARRSALS